MTKFFLKATVAAALAASGVAQAALVPAHTGDGEMMFTLFDSVAEISYTLDLGVLSKAFRTAADLDRQTLTSGDGVAAATSAPGDMASFNWVLSGAEFAKFSAASAAASSGVANWRFSVFGGDQVGANRSPNGLSLVTTVTKGTEEFFAEQKNSLLNLAIQTAGTYADAANQLGDAAMIDSSGSANGSAFGDVTNGLYQPGNPKYFNANGGGVLSFTTDAAVGEAANVYYFTRSGSSQNAFILSEQFNDSFGNVGQFTVDQTATGYELNYNIPAVPEPGTYGLMAAGLLLVGGIARRRRG